MIEQIGQTLVSLIGDIVPTYYSEAETESYPYCVYDQIVEDVKWKDGTAMLRSDCSVNVYSDVFDDADVISQKVIDAIVKGMHDSRFSARLKSAEKTCGEGIWRIELSFEIKQYS